MFEDAYNAEDMFPDDRNLPEDDDDDYDIDAFSPLAIVDGQFDDAIEEV